MNTENLIQYDCRSGVSYTEVLELYERVKGKHHFSADKFWAWKMFDLGFAYGKHAERASRRGGKNHE